MSIKVCRWGIIGAANIARKNWQAIHDAGNSSLVAVASRDGERTARFISECQGEVPFANRPEVAASYDALIARDDIDAVYLPLPTGPRKLWAIRAAEAGKHVVVEKPVGGTLNDAEEIVAACERNGVQFMDGVMFMHSQRLKQMGEVLRDGKSIGQIRRVACQFAFAGDDAFFSGNIRSRIDLEPLGCLGDLGWYCIRFILWALNHELPLEVTGRILRETGGAEGGVPSEFCGELFYRDGISASYQCSFHCGLAQWGIVSGTKGYLHVPDFVLPYTGNESGFSVTQSEFLVNGCRFDMREGRTETRVAGPSNNAPGSAEANLFRTFSDLVLSGKIDRFWPEVALKTQQVLNRCLESARLGGTTIPLERAAANHSRR